MIKQTITKTLSANDAGETGGHQAGLLVPREPYILSFFPSLDTSTLNPRAHIRFEDQSGQFWNFAFIYYNNRFFGGTRNEYRLTRMTAYIRESGLVTGDEVIMHRNSDGEYSIAYRRAHAPPAGVDQGNILIHGEGGRPALELGSGWKVIDF